MALAPARWKFTVEDYHRMAETGILSEDARIELVEGEILTTSPIGHRHTACVNRLNRWLSSSSGQMSIISIQNPLRLNSFNEPEPDVAVLRFRRDFYDHALPAASDVTLIIEVAETSLEYDRRVKAPLYAQAMIPELWIVDLNHLDIEIYTQPVNGTYQSVQIVRGTESLAAKSEMGLEITVAEIVG